MQALVDVVLPVFLVIASGYISVWAGFLSDAAMDGLAKFAQSFAIPCLLFRAISSLDLGQSFDLALLLSFYAGATLCYVAGVLGARILFRRPWDDCIAIGFCCLFSNSVLLGLVITERAYGPQALAGNYAIIALHAAFCYGLGILSMELLRAGQEGLPGLPGKLAKAVFRNALLIGVAAGFAVNLSGLRLPVPVLDAVDLIVQAALPAAIFALGGVLVRYRPEGDLRIVGFICTISLMLHPAITWSLGKSLALSGDAMRSAVMTASMAPGVNAYLFANSYGVAKRVAATTVLAATLVSVGSIWIWLQILP